MPKDVTVALELSLEETAVRTLCSAVNGNLPTTTKIGRIATGLLKDLAEGGLMLPAESVIRIKKAIASVDSEDIVSKVESGANRQGDHLLFTTAVDPVWEPRLKEIADSRGIPVMALMQEIVGAVLFNGWLYDNVVPPEPTPVSFSRPSYEFLRKTVAAGGPLFGEDIAAWARAHTEVAKSAAIRE